MRDPCHPPALTPLGDRMGETLKAQTPTTEREVVRLSHDQRATTSTSESMAEAVRQAPTVGMPPGKTQLAAVERILDVLDRPA